MRSEVVLMQDVEGLGRQGDVMKVAPGYARNCLFPKKLAAPATEKYIKMLELDKARKAAQVKREFTNLQEFAEKLGQASCTLPMQAGDDGTLFGSVTAQHVADALQQQGFQIDKKNIVLPEHIKELGVYSVEVKLHPEVTATVKVWVVEK